MEQIFVAKHKMTTLYKFTNFYVSSYHPSLIKIMKAPCQNCENFCGKNRVLPEVARKLDEGFQKLYCCNSQSLLKKYLTSEVYNEIKGRKTKYGSTLLDCIQSGIENLDSGVGIYAADPLTYNIFAPIFDPIIEEYHGFKKTDCHPPLDWGDPKTLQNLDPKGEYVISTRVRCGRSIEGFPFNPNLTEQQYLELENKISKILKGLTGELQGKYLPLDGMTKQDQQKLIDDHFLFKEGDRFLQAANSCRYWPKGRGIFHNDKKTFLVWVGEEDHVRIMSMQPGGNLPEVYGRLIKGVQAIEKEISFSRNDRLGYLTFCPTNLGSTIRASVHIKLPKISTDKQYFDEIARKFNLQIRGTSGEHSDSQSGIYDVSNKRRLGLTEYMAVKEMHDGILELIKIEKSKK